jgi:hypothetical protein
VNSKSTRRARWEALKYALDAAEIPFVLHASYTVRVEMPEKGTVYMTARVSEAAEPVVRARWFNRHGPVLEADPVLVARTMTAKQLVTALKEWRASGTRPA